MNTNQKGFVGIILLAVIAVSIFGGGIYIYNQNKTNIEQGQSEKFIFEKSVKDSAEPPTAADIPVPVSAVTTKSDVKVNDSVQKKEEEIKINTEIKTNANITTSDSTPALGSIQITYPSGGESFERGKAYSITFNAGDKAGKLLRLRLASDDPNFSREFAGTDEALSGTQSLYLIVPPDAPIGSKYKVMIYECVGSKTSGCYQSNNTLLTSSSGHFSIQ